MKRILNLGCGNETYGTDRVDYIKTKTTTKVADLNKKFPYPSNSFDEIYSCDALEHMRNLGSFADECYRVLKKGGKIYIRTDNAAYLPYHLHWGNREHNTFLNTIYKKIGEAHPGDHHYHLFVASHLKYLFNKFKNQKVGYIYAGGNPLKKFFLRLLPARMGAIGIYISAEK